MRFLWPESARAELRAIDRETAIRILHALSHTENLATVISRHSAANGKAIFGCESAITASSLRYPQMKLLSLACAIGLMFIGKRILELVRVS